MILLMALSSSSVVESREVQGESYFWLLFRGEYPEEWSACLGGGTHLVAADGVGASVITIV